MSDHGNGTAAPASGDSDPYVDADAFEALEEAGEGRDGIDWAEKVPEVEWREHEDRLRSVIDAQQEAEVLGTELIGSSGALLAGEPPANNRFASMAEAERQGGMQRDARDRLAV